MGWGRESCLVPAEIASISGRDLAKATSLTHSSMLYRVEISIFIFMLNVFFQWNFIKNVSLPLSSITFKVNGHKDNYFYVFFLNIVQY